MSKHNISKPILITGAGGKIGGVSTFVVEFLRKEGIPVRATVRKDDERAEELRKLGAEVIVADLTVLGDVRRALKGVDRIYFSISVGEAYITASLLVTTVAKHYGIEVFVNMSQLSIPGLTVESTIVSPQVRSHWLAEQALTWSGLPVVNIYPHIFLENPYFTRWIKNNIVQHNELRLPFGQGRIPPIAAYDVARVVFAILLNPAPYIGKPIALVGPEIVSMDEIARQFGEALGRPIKYVPVPLEEWNATVLKPAVETGEIEAHTAAHLHSLAGFVGRSEGNSNRPIGNQVEKITGKPPLSVAEWVKQRADYFK